MDKKPAGTKLDLLLAAGELFAENGLNGTGVRAIAEKADANIAAINYHFGSKENLYLEALRYVLLNHESARTDGFLEKAEPLASSDDFPRLLYEIVKVKFNSYFSRDKPLWHARLIMRTFLEPSHALLEVVKQHLEPDQEALMEIIRRAQPRLTEEDIQFFAYSLIGQIAFYMFARAPLLMVLGKDHYDDAFLDAAAKHVARTIVVALGLPEPSGGAEASTVAGHSDSHLESE